MIYRTTNSRINVKNILYIVIVFVIIYCSHDTMLFGTNSNELFVSIRKIVPFVISFLLLGMMLLEKTKIQPSGLFCFAILLSLPLISCFANGEEIYNYIYRLALMFDGFLLVMYSKKEQFESTFSNILIFLCIWSLIFWGLSTFIPNFPNLFPKIINSSGYKYPNFIFSTVDSDSRYIFKYRNSGIFREPGVFASIISIAILFELKKEKCSYKKIFVFLVSLITTFSTAGFIILALISVYFLIFGQNTKKQHKIFLLIMCFSLLAFILFGGAGFLGSTGIFDKFNSKSNSYGSWYARWQSVVGNITLALRNPIVGIGRYHLYDTVLATLGNFSAVDNTNTFLINFSAFGIIYGLLCIIGAFKYFRVESKGILTTIFSFVILFIALSNEDLGQNIVYFYLIISGLLSHQKSKKVSLHYGEKYNINQSIKLG